jgi:hypothetical protein
VSIGFLSLWVAFMRRNARLENIPILNRLPEWTRRFVDRGIEKGVRKVPT